MEQEALIAIYNYLDYNPQELDTDFAGRLKDGANDALRACAASRIDQAKTVYALDHKTFNPLPSQVNANNGHNLAAIMDRFKLRKTDLPGNIQTKINDKIADQISQHKSAAEIDKAIAEVIVTEALKVADSDHASFAQQQRAVYAATRHAAQHEDNPTALLRNNTDLTRGVGKIMDRHGGSYWGDTLSDAKKQIYNGAPGSFATNDVVSMQKTEFQQRKDRAIGNLRSTMQAIVGSRNNDDDRTAAIQRVPPKTRQMLATIAQGARDGRGAQHARNAALNSFVLRSLMPGLTIPGDKAKELGVWDQGRQHSLNHKSQQASLTFTGRLANGVFMRSHKSLQVEADSFQDRSKPELANSLLRDIEIERSSWFDPAAQFLDQVVQSGQQLNNS